MRLRVLDLHDEALLQAAVEAAAARHVQRGVGLVADGAVVDGVRLAGGDDVEDAGLLHAPDGVRGPAHQRAVVHLGLQSASHNFAAFARRRSKVWFHIEKTLVIYGCLG